eukprot:scaffold1054_cov366-Prasinococcus_capsulatus_cf.AAC.16
MPSPGTVAFASRALPCSRGIHSSDPGRPSGKSSSTARSGARDISTARKRSGASLWCGRKPPTELRTTTGSASSFHMTLRLLALLPQASTSMLHVNSSLDAPAWLEGGELCVLLCEGV